MAVEIGRTPTPQSIAKAFRSRGFSESHEKFLEGEEAAVARLVGFYQQAQQELTRFMLSGETTKSDDEFYTQLLLQVNGQVAKLNGGSREWAEATLPTAFVAGAQLTGGEDFLFRPVHDRALRELSGYTLGLIRDTNEGIRRSVQQAVASGISTGISREELVQRIVDSGLQGGPWRDAATRAGVIARTETMRSYNAGNVSAIRETGTVAVTWHTARDEKTCPTCEPLDGRGFVMPGISDEDRAAAGVPAEWPQLEAVGQRGNVLKVPPRHPRCRCTVRARYRGDDGQLLGDVPVVEAEIRAQAASVRAPEPAPATSALDLREPLSLEQYAALNTRRVFTEALRQGVIETLEETPGGRLLADSLLKWQQTGSIARLRTAVWNRMNGIEQNDTANARADGIIGAIRGFPMELVPEQLHRGSTPKQSIESLLERYKPGAILDLNLTSFSSDRKKARAFAGDLPGMSNAPKRGQVSVVTRLIGPKHALPIQNTSKTYFFWKEKEWVSMGRFEVVDTRTTWSGGRQRVDVTIRQVIGP